MPKSSRSKESRRLKSGRVIRAYKREIPADEFSGWKEQLRRRKRGCGLYALYCGNQLMYVGLATKGIRHRLARHLKDKKKPFTHFSVFLVTGQSSAVQARRIRDLEALLLKIIKPLPKWNNSETNFVASKKLLQASRSK